MAPCTSRLKFAIDLTQWTLAGVLAFVLRQPGDWQVLDHTIPLWALVTLAITAFLIRAFRLHRQTWRQVSVQDLLDRAKRACLVCVARTEDGLLRLLDQHAGIAALGGHALLDLARRGEQRA